MALNSGIKIKYLGHSTFLFTTPGGKHLLIDPWVENNPACPQKDKQLPGLDTMLITHGHGDHMQDAVSLAKKHKPQVACIYEIALWLGGKGVENVTGMNKGGGVRLNDIKATMVNAHHSSAIIDDGGKIVYAGEPAGFVVEFENGFTIYHAGDTCVFGDMKIIGDLYKPDLAMLPIGDLYTMGPKEAALACQLLGTKKVIPMHYATFPVLTGTPAELQQLTAAAGTEVIVMNPGDEIDS
ncbi:MAG: metal-dependent hydrolase [Acidobacteriota bacterium]|nr:MAG: metal-dependent hydrolase [Acidobacteriota bacterium]